MAQAKVLSEAELKRALAVVAGRRHADRDRLALLLTHWAGTPHKMMPFLPAVGNGT